MAGRERPGRLLPPVVEAGLFPLVRPGFSCALAVEKAEGYTFTWRTRP